MSLTNHGDALAVTTPTDTEIVLSRVFDAPRRLVFDALTRPDLLVRWHGAQGWNLVVCEVDLRVGGAWRFVSRGPGGAEMGKSGVYREIVPPERLVHTEAFDEWDSSEAVVTTVLDEHAGRTTLMASVRYPSRELRDAVVGSRMARGVGESYDRLAEVLAAARIADRYRRIHRRFSEVAAAVPDGAWANQSPCEAWTARDVVRHLVDMSAFLLGLVDQTLPADAPSVDDDPLGAWLAARDTVQALLDDPETAAQQHREHRHLGTGPWNRAVDMVLTSDAVIHTWDLARAVGIDERIDPDELRRLVTGIESMPEEVMRQPEVFGPALEPPAGVDEQARLLAVLGRKGW